MFKKLLIFFTCIFIFGCVANVPSTEELSLKDISAKKDPQLDLKNDNKNNLITKNIQTEKLKKIKLPFIENQGQVDPKVKFYANTFAGTVYVTDNDLVYNLPFNDGSKEAKNKKFNPSKPNDNLEDKKDEAPKKAVVLREKFINAKTSKLFPEGGEKNEAVFSSFIGNDKSKWISGSATYDSVKVGEPWEGISLELHAYGNNVEKLFTVEPGIDPKKIALSFEGAKDFKIDSNTGELVVNTELGDIKFTKPIAYQLKEGKKEEVKVAYSSKNQGYGFDIGNYDNSVPLIIDPLLASTFLGGGGDEYGHGITIDSGGNIYVTGDTNSNDFPTTVGAYSTTYTIYDIFVSKFNSTLTSLLASTYIGGSFSGDYSYSIACDSGDNIYITGYTDSSNYPTTGGAYDTSLTGSLDAFVSKFNSTLTTLSASTFIGGSTDDVANAIVIDSSNNIYITGYTYSTDYPTTGGAYDTTLNNSANGQDVFISKLNSTLTTLSASTFLGDGANGTGITLDSSENVYVVGYTGASSFPTTGGAYDTSYDSNIDIFVSKLNSTLTTLSASTFIGGSGTDAAYNIALDSSDNVYITGFTANNGTYPTTGGAYDTSYNGGNDVVVSKFNSSLTTLSASTFIGGASTDYGYAIVIDASNNVYVAGSADTGYPTTVGVYDASYNGGGDVFVSKLNSTLTTLSASTFIGDVYYDTPYGIVLDGSNNVYITGSTASSDYPTTTGAYSNTHNGSDEVFISKFDSDLSATIDNTAPTVTNVTSSTTNGSYKAGDAVSIQVVFDEAVIVTGTPQLTLETGASDAVVNYASGSGTTTLTFTYTISSGHTSSDLDYVATTSLALNSGTIKDAALNNATLTLASPGAAGSLGNNKALVIDTTAPTVSNVTSSTANGSYKSGDAISIQVVFSEAVTVTGTPQLTLETGSTDRTINYVSGSGGTTLTFTYTVQAGDTSSDLDYVGTSSLALNSGAIRDAALNNATLTLVSPGASGSLGNNKALVVDTTAPTVSNITSSTANGSYKSGDAISIQVVFSEAVTVTGTPQLTLETGSTDRTINYVSGSGGTTLTFTYIVQAGDISSDLDYVGTSSLTLNSGTIRDAALNNATLTLASPGASGSLGNNKALIVDTTAPTVAITSSASSATNTSPIPVTITFNESVTGFVVGDITVGNGSAGNFAGSGTTYTADITPSGQGAVTVDVSSSVAADAAGNNNTAATQLSRTYDSIVPTVVITSSASSPTNTSPIPVIITFSESVTGFVIGDITIGNGSAGNFAGSGTTYTADITPSAQGTVTVDVGSSVAGDTAGNGNTAATQLSRTYDSVVPTVSDVTSSTTNGSYKAGDTISIQVVFMEAVTVTGTPQLTLETGSTDRTINYASGTGTTTLTFTYTVQAGDTSTDLDYVGTTSLALNSGTIRDTATNNATLTLASPGASGSLGNNKALVIDTTAPTVAITSSASSPTNISPISVTIIFNESVIGFIVGDITVGNGSAGNFAGSGTTYTADITPTSQGAVTVDVGSSVATDAVGNNNSAATQFSITYSISTPTPTPTPVAPTINIDQGSQNTPISSLSGTATAGVTVEVFSDSTSLGTTTADENGVWTLPLITPLVLGDFNLSVSDSDGHSSSPVEISVPQSPLDFNEDGVSDVTLFGKGYLKWTSYEDSDGEGMSLGGRKSQVASSDYDGDGMAEIATITHESKKNIGWNFYDSQTQEVSKELFGKTANAFIIGCNFDSSKEKEMVYLKGSKLSFKHKGSSNITTVNLSSLYSDKNLRGCGDVDSDGIDELLFKTISGKGKNRKYHLVAVNINGSVALRQENVGDFRLAYIADAYGDSTKDILLKMDRKGGASIINIWEIGGSSLANSISVRPDGNFNIGVCKDSGDQFQVCLLYADNQQEVVTYLLKTGETTALNIPTSNLSIVSSVIIYSSGLEILR